MSLLSSVLFFGHDELLLLTRGRIFELAGFRVCFAQELRQVSELIRERSVDLIVLCHSLSGAECEAAASTGENERIQVLRLLFTEEECRRTEGLERMAAHGIFDSMRGPIALLEEACSMLRAEQRWTPAEALLAFAAKGGLA
jgi:DNA-binding response OmpR family regulator